MDLFKLNSLASIFIQPIQEFEFINCIFILYFRYSSNGHSLFTACDRGIVRRYLIHGFYGDSSGYMRFHPTRMKIFSFTACVKGMVTRYLIRGFSGEST